MIFDPEKEVILTGDKLHSAAHYTSFEGWKMKGYPVATVCGEKRSARMASFLLKKAQSAFCLPTLASLFSCNVLPIIYEGDFYQWAIVFTILLVP